MSRHVTPIQATVYATKGRRYLTKAGAYRGLARKMILARCECEDAEYGDNEACFYGGSACKYHGANAEPGTLAWSYPERLERRLARHLAYRDSLEPKPEVPRG